MESLVILVVAAGVAAAVVWWAMSSSDRRGGEKMPRKVSVPEPSWVLADDPADDGFVLLPTSERVEDRPSRAVSLIRLIVTIAFVAGAAVALLTAIGMLIKLQLDQYFHRLGG